MKSCSVCFSFQNSDEPFGSLANSNQYRWFELAEQLIFTLNQRSIYIWLYFFARLLLALEDFSNTMAAVGRRTPVIICVIAYWLKPGKNRKQNRVTSIRAQETNNKQFIKVWLRSIEMCTKGEWIRKFGGEKVNSGSSRD